jgi:hypothetical protein
VGGLIGFNDTAGVVASVSASATVKGVTDVGGLVGYNGGKLSAVFATGAVSGGSANTGGLVGENVSTGGITDAYALSSTSGSAQVGGLVGLNFGAIATSYADGVVSGSVQLGGAVGANQAGGSLQNVYWDVANTGQAAAAGSNAGTLTNVTGVGGSTGKNPYAQATYAGFNFSTVWAINPGSSRPFLKAVAGGTPPS